MINNFDNNNDIKAEEITFEEIDFSSNTNNSSKQQDININIPTSTTGGKGIFNNLQEEEEYERLPAGTYLMTIKVKPEFYITKSGKFSIKIGLQEPGGKYEWVYLNYKDEEGNFINKGLNNIRKFLSNFGVDLTDKDLNYAYSEMEKTTGKEIGLCITETPWNDTVYRNVSFKTLEEIEKEAMQQLNK